MGVSRLGWHFLAGDRKLRHRNFTKVIVGQKLEWRDNDTKKWCKINEVEICRSGMHASSLIIDAESYADSYIYENDNYGWLCRVKVDGTNYGKRNHPRGAEHSRGKFVGTHRTALGMVPVRWLIDTFGDATNWDAHHNEIIDEMNRRNKRNKNSTKVR